MMFDPIKQMFRWSLRKKGKRVFNICRKYVQMTALMASLALSATAAHAAPEGGVVTAGSATISSGAGSVEIHQSSSRAVIEWGSFDIASGETVQFIQPGTSSIALNRITTSGQLTTINGNLLANGKVVVINPNGVLIGAQGRVDTAGFIASAADTDTALFMSGAEKLYFNNAGRADAAVENRGHITVSDAGLALLVAPTVKNSGVIEGSMARLQMGAGDTFGVDLYGDGLFYLGVAHDGKRELRAENSGTIVASAGKVLMTAAAASDIVNSVINTTGVIEATSLVKKGGEIILTGVGADVKVAGKIDASGKTGGGTIRIGGDPAGQGTLAKAATVDIAQGTVIRADAIETGDGGSIALWSENLTTSRGSFSARGGTSGGNGGFVETSSRLVLDVGGTTVDTGAAFGRFGLWLLDPTTLNIDAALAASINAALSNVSLVTSDGLTFSADINIAAYGVGLSVQSGAGGIQMNNGYIRLNGGDLAMLTTGAITINGAGGQKVIYTNGGDISMTGSTISINNAALGTGSGDVLIYATSMPNGNAKTVSINSTYISTSGGDSLGGIDLHDGLALTLFTGTSAQKAARFGNTQNAFETTADTGVNGGKITIKGKTIGGNSNCFSAGGTNCFVSDPVPQPDPQPEPEPDPQPEPEPEPQPEPEPDPQPEPEPDPQPEPEPDPQPEPEPEPQPEPEPDPQPEPEPDPQPAPKILKGFDKLWNITQPKTVQPTAGGQQASLVVPDVPAAAPAQNNAAAKPESAGESAPAPGMQCSLKEKKSKAASVDCKLY